MTNLQISKHNHEPLKFNGQPIITTESLAQSLGVDVANLNRNFQNNKDRYQIGTHYFLLQGAELQDFRLHTKNLPVQISSKTRQFYLWTEKGAFNHVKSVGTDQAWDAYQNLVDTYFRQREALQAISDTQVFKLPQTFSEALMALAIEVEAKEKLEAKIKADEPKILFVDAVAETDNHIEMAEVAKILKIGRNNLFKFLREKKVLNDNNIPYQVYMARPKYFRVVDKIVTIHDKKEVKPTTLVGIRGQAFIEKLLRESKAKKQA